MGPYILTEPIGSGSLGAVFKAAGKADRQPYAVKVLPLRSLWNVRMARRQVRTGRDPGATSSDTELASRGRDQRVRDVSDVGIRELG